MVASSSILIADTPELRARCFPVMQQLRPHLTDPDHFLRAVERLAVGADYHCVCLVNGENVVSAVSCYRYSENLAWGYHMYVDDLVTDTNQRSQGYGSILLKWLIDEARRKGCTQFHLDSANFREGAHRFYEREGVPCTSKHFCTVL